MIHCKKFSIVQNDETAPGYRLMCLQAPEIAMDAKPGQFLHVRCAESTDPLLRRPISIHSVQRDTGLIFMFYRIAGRGTSLLAAMQKGQEIDVLGPLGRGFELPGPGERVAVVGGGIGAAPLFFLAEEIIAGHEHSAGAAGGDAFPLQVNYYLGAATAGMLPPTAVLADSGILVHLATDDGSVGFHGTVAGLLKQHLDSQGDRSQFHRIYACGPEPMLRVINDMASSRGIAGQVSLEERMGCGVGACLSCACKIKNISGSGFTYKHACSDGPVFNIGEVWYED
jgi:dihydroorotate dehydrogenase electron transfer subunit